jgi:hypothetical protein
MEVIRLEAGLPLPIDRPDLSEPRTLIGALVEGVSFATRLDAELAREEKVLRATAKAARAVKALRRFIRALVHERESPTNNTPLDRPDFAHPGELERAFAGLHILGQLIEDRAAMATRSKVVERFGVSREAVSVGLGMEGVRLSAKRIRAAVPKVTLKQIAAVLNCAFKTAAIDEVILKDLTGRKRVR